MPVILAFDCQHCYPAGFTLDAQFETDGHLTALYGPSGSGKTTILSLVAGLLRPQRGSILLQEQPLTDTRTGVFVSPEDRHVGMLFQDNCLFPHLRVRGNITYGARRRGEARIEFDRVVEMLELDDLLDRYPHSLSGGQKQRVALGRAIASGPTLLLLDEPLTSVEEELRDRIAAFIETVVREFAIPTLLVSHNRSLVDRLADRVIFIEGGRISTFDEQS